nr:MAG TPA: hypothetical protein [Caudoviricetes sp.]
MFTLYTHMGKMSRGKKIEKVIVFRDLHISK